MTEAFARYFGGLEPALVVVGAVLVGAVALVYLGRRGGFQLLRAEGIGKGLLRVSILATVLAVPPVIVDIISPFPKDINVAIPEALVFYPVIGLVAEVAFHLVPLALLFSIDHLAASTRPTTRRTNTYVAIVATVEAVFQIAAGWGQSPAWVSVYLAVHLTVFALLQLRAFKNHGFVAMVAFRLVYYVHWHLLWGELRLNLLFD